MKKWRKLESSIEYQNPYFKVRKDRVLQNSGQESDYYTVEKRDAAIIAALTSDGQLVMIEQYRHPVDDIDFELPAGYLEEGESPEQAAHRELLEETGYEVEKLQKIGEAYANAGLNNHKAHFFVGFNARKTQSQQLDDNEEIEVFLSSPEEAKKLLEEGKIKDLGSIACLMLALERI